MTLLAASEFCSTVTSTTVFLDFVGTYAPADEEMLSIYPNPAKDHLRGSLKQAEQANLILYTISGIALPAWRRTFSGNLDLDIRDLPKGIYIVLVEIGGQWYRQRLVK